MRVPCTPILLLLGSVASADRPPPRYRVDLDDAPEDRWNQIFGDPAVNASLWGALAAIKNVSALYKYGLDAAGALPVDDLAWNLPDDQAREAWGIARLTGLPVGQLWAVNALYDLTAANASDHAFCTSIIAQDAAGTIVHARNLDYPLSDAMRPLTATP